MRCQDIMKSDVKCVSPNDTVQTAARRMRDENIGFLPVCDQSRKVVGTVTDRDLAIRVLSEASPPSVRISDVMTREIVSCRPEDELSKAQELMAKHRKSRIMCLDASGRLVGVISLSDIAQREDGVGASKTLRQVSMREARV